MKIRKVTDKLFISSHTLKSPIPVVIERLADHDITYVVAVAPRADERLQERWRGRYFHIPMSDGTKVNVRQFATATKMVGDLIAAGFNVLVHCNAGRNRSAAVAAAVWAKRDGLKAEDVISAVRDIRPRALANPIWVEYLHGTLR